MRDAVVTSDGMYRYALTREWAEGPRVCWIMLNPSIADAEIDDPTIRRCIGFSKREGAGSLTVVNLYAYRATNPQDLIDSLYAGIDIVGVDNMMHTRFAVHQADLVICGWGDSATKIPGWLNKTERLAALVGARARCLGRTKGHNQPRHPLYVKGDQSLEPVWRAGGDDGLALL